MNRINRRAKWLIGLLGLAAVIWLYAPFFAVWLAWRAQTAVHEHAYCIVAPLTAPPAFSGWSHNGLALRQVKDFSELSLVEIVLRRLEGRAARFRYTQPIHFGIVAESRAYHWSFWGQRFVENNSYVDFRRESNRAGKLPPTCTVP